MEFPVLPSSSTSRRGRYWLFPVSYRRLVTVWMPYLFLSVGRQMAIKHDLLSARMGWVPVSASWSSYVGSKGKLHDRSAIILYATSAYWYSWWYGPHLSEKHPSTQSVRRFYHPLDVRQDRRSTLRTRNANRYSIHGSIAVNPVSLHLLPFGRKLHLNSGRWSPVLWSPEYGLFLLRSIQR